MNRGFTRVPNAVIAAADLTPLEKLVLIALLMHARDSEKCFPGEDTLAGLARCSVRTVRRSLAAIARKGIIGIARGGKGNPNTYTIVEGYDRTLVSALSPDDRTWVSCRSTLDRTNPASLTGQSLHESASMTGHGCPPNNTVFNNTQTTTPCAVEFLIKRMTEAGLSDRQARELISAHPADRIQRQLDWLPKRKPRSRAVVLIRAIREDWGEPVVSDGTERFRPYRELVKYQELQPDPEPGSPEFEEAARREAERARVIREAIAKGRAAQQDYFRNAGALKADDTPSDGNAA